MPGSLTSCSFTLDVKAWARDTMATGRRRRPHSRLSPPRGVDAPCRCITYSLNLEQLSSLSSSIKTHQPVTTGSRSAISTWPCTKYTHQNVKMLETTTTTRPSKKTGNAESSRHSLRLKRGWTKIKKTARNFGKVFSRKTKSWDFETELHLQSSLVSNVFKISSEIS